MPQVTNVQRRRRVASIRRAAAILAVVVVVSAVVVVMRQMTAGQKHKDLVAQQARLEAAHNASAETALLISYVDSKPPRAYEQPAQEKLGDLELAQRQYTQASSWYVRAAAGTSRPDLNLVVGMARSAAGLGDKATAIHYYQQAITMTTNTTTIGQYRDAIDGLERPQ